RYQRPFQPIERAQTLRMMLLATIQTGNDETCINKHWFHDLPNPSMCFLLVARSGIPESNIPVPIISSRLAGFFRGFFPFAEEGATSILMRNGLPTGSLIGLSRIITLPSKWPVMVLFMISSPDRTRLAARENYPHYPRSAWDLPGTLQNAASH